MAAATKLYSADAAENSGRQAESFSVVGIRDVDVQDFRDEPHWREVLRYFFRHKGAAIAFFVLVAVILFALLGPLLTDFTYDDLNPKRQNLPPRVPGIEQLGILDGTRDGQNVYATKGMGDEYHYFGTDNLGRDLWARTCYGVRISLYVALAAVLIDAVIGITLGLLCGYFGGAFDMVVQRIIEIVAGIPQLVVVTLLLIVLKPGLYTITIALMMTSWIGMSRVVRAQVLQHKEREYVLASKTMGTPTVKLLFREILPNTISQISSAVAQEGINIDNLINKSKKEMAVTVMEMAAKPSQAAIDAISRIPGVVRVRIFG